MAENQEAVVRSHPSPFGDVVQRKDTRLRTSECGFNSLRPHRKCGRVDRPSFPKRADAGATPAASIATWLLLVAEFARRVVRVARSRSDRKLRLQLRHQGAARPADPSRVFRVCTRSENRAGRNPAALRGPAGSTPAAPMPGSCGREARTRAPGCGERENAGSNPARSPDPTIPLSWPNGEGACLPSRLVRVQVPPRAFNSTRLWLRG